MKASEETARVELPHLLHLDGRRHLTLSGVTDVESFDETAVVAATSLGTLVVHGTDLHVATLSLDSGDLKVDGHIDSLTYEDDGPRQSGLFSKLFK